MICLEINVYMFFLREMNDLQNKVGLMYILVDGIIKGKNSFNIKGKMFS